MNSVYDKFSIMELRNILKLKNVAIDDLILVCTVLCVKIEKLEKEINKRKGER